MYIYLFDRPDRLGSQIVCYVSQILFADKYNLIIKLKKTNIDDKLVLH